MQERRSNLQFKQIIIHRKKKKAIDRIMMPVNILQILHDQRKDQFTSFNNHIHRNPISNETRSRKLQEMMSKSIGKSSHLLSQLVRKNKQQQNSTKKLRLHEEGLHPKVNHIVFRTEIEELVKTIESQHRSSSPNRFLNKTSYEPKFNLSSLHRTFKLSDYCRSSLLQISRQNKFKRWESFCNSISYRSTPPQAKISKKQLTMRSTLKPRYRTISENTRKKEELRGWQQHPLKYKTLYDDPTIGMDVR